MVCIMYHCKAADVSFDLWPHYSHLFSLSAHYLPNGDSEERVRPAYLLRS